MTADPFMMPQLQRSVLMYGEDAIQRLQHSHVVIAGVGGVGGFAAEAIARAGVGKMTLIDHDRVSISNLNRQLIALHSTIDQPKVDVLAQRLRDINPALDLILEPTFMHPDTQQDLLRWHDQPAQALVDAIDSLNPKVQLIRYALQHQVPVFSSMGAGRRLDPSQIQVADIQRTHTCALARAVRQRLRKAGVHKGVTCVFSSEIPNATGEIEVIEGGRNRVVNGSTSFMPGLFGLTLAGLVVNHLAVKK